MGLDLEYPVERLRGADYNPRAINADALDTLVSSIGEVGFAKPVIVDKGADLIIAGHQRTKAARKMGRTHVPAWLLENITKTDQIRFNQLHNGTDVDVVDKPVRVPRSEIIGLFVDVPGSEIEGDLRSTGAGIRQMIAKLLARYGLWGGAVASASGEVLTGQQYALACKLLRLPCRTFYVEDEKADIARGFFGRTYGVFSYDHLPRATYIQTFAQPFRLTEGAKTDNASMLYEQKVLKELRKEDRALDFGCGRGDYVKKLRGEGFDIRGIEFFRRRGHLIDTAAVHA
jgi:ParB family chromosome partitioning protein